MPEDVHKEYIPVECHYLGHRRDPYDLDLKQYIIDNAPNNPGGSGLSLESYQNSAMSAAVMAYVFRDEDDNIFRVYEPIRNNDVSRYQFEYADSVDKFPFDSTDCFNNVIRDVKINDVSAFLQIQGSTLESMVILGNGFQFLRLFNHKHKGLYGVGCPNEAEIYLIGNDVAFFNNDCSASDENYPCCFDNIGAFSRFTGNTLKGCNVHDSLGDGGIINLNECVIGSGGDIYFNGFLASVQYSNIGNEGIVHFVSAGGVADLNMGPSCEIVIGSNDCSNISMDTSCTIGDPESDPKKCFADLQNVRIGLNSSLAPSVNNTDSITDTRIGLSCDVATDGNFSVVRIGDYITYAPAGAKANKQISNIAGTTYEQGVTDVDGVLTQTLVAV